MNRLLLTTTCGLLLALSFAPALSAQGGPPMITDDPGTPGDGHWEVNTALTLERRSGERVAELPLLDINYGLGERVQLKYEASWLVEKVEGESSHSGVSNSLAGVKWRFYDAGEHGLAISTYPQIEFHNPGSRADERGLAEHGTMHLLPLEFQKDLGPVGVNWEIGREFHNKADDDVWIYGVAVGHAFGENYEVAAELHGTRNRKFDRSECVANFGVRAKLTEQSRLLLSIGRELHNHFESRATLVSYLGW